MLNLKPDLVNVRDLVVADLKELHIKEKLEIDILNSCGSARAKGRRMLHLFQCDLLPGVSGKILESKSNRDNKTYNAVSKRMKILGYLVVSLCNAGMIFYIFLFALLQSADRQNAWFESFLIWIAIEILFVSTTMVILTHIIMPMIIMKDITKIKQKLTDNISAYRESVSKDERNNGGEDSFNAADYLFVSTRIAKSKEYGFAKLKESQIIAQFSTPWPRQSYQHVKDVSKTYSKKFTAFTRSFSAVIMFLIGGLLNFPPAIQDMIIQMASTATIGYGILIHLTLYNIFPVLVIVPLIVVIVIVHFYVRSNSNVAIKKLSVAVPHDGGFQSANKAMPLHDGAESLSTAIIDASVIANGITTQQKEDSVPDYGDSTASQLPSLLPRKAGQDWRKRANISPRTRRESLVQGLGIVQQLQSAQLSRRQRLTASEDVVGRVHGGSCLGSVASNDDDGDDDRHSSSSSYSSNDDHSRSRGSSSDDSDSFDDTHAVILRDLVHKRGRRGAVSHSTAPQNLARKTSVRNRALSDSCLSTDDDNNDHRDGSLSPLHMAANDSGREYHVFSKLQQGALRHKLLNAVDLSDFTVPSDQNIERDSITVSEIENTSIFGYGDGEGCEISVDAAGKGYGGLDDPSEITVHLDEQGSGSVLTASGLGRGTTATAELAGSLGVVCSDRQQCLHAAGDVASSFVINAVSVAVHNECRKLVTHPTGFEVSAVWPVTGSTVVGEGGVLTATPSTAFAPQQHDADIHIAATGAAINVIMDGEEHSLSSLSTNSVVGTTAPGQQQHDERVVKGAEVGVEPAAHISDGDVCSLSSASGSDSDSVAAVSFKGWTARSCSSNSFSSESNVEMH
jgi:hypothetical protein